MWYSRDVFRDVGVRKRVINLHNEFVLIDSREWTKRNGNELNVTKISKEEDIVESYDHSHLKATPYINFYACSLWQTQNRINLLGTILGQILRSQFLVRRVSFVDLSSGIGKDNKINCTALKSTWTCLTKGQIRPDQWSWSVQLTCDTRFGQRVLWMPDWLGRRFCRIRLPFRLRQNDCSTKVIGSSLVCYSTHS